MQKPAAAKEPLLDTAKQWKARLVVSFIMLAPAFISLFIMEIQNTPRIGSPLASCPL